MHFQFRLRPGVVVPGHELSPVRWHRSAGVPHPDTNADRHAYCDTDVDTDTDADAHTVTGAGPVAGKWLEGDSLLGAGELSRHYRSARSEAQAWLAGCGAELSSQY